MKRIITGSEGLIAGEIFSHPGNPDYQFTKLYRSNKGTFFFYAGGGPSSDYASKWGTNKITTRIWTPNLPEVIDWLAEVAPHKALELFPEHFEA